MRPADLLFSHTLRQNHALEHATVTLLTRSRPNLAVSARSSSRGFTIFADLDLALVQQCADEALARLRAGEAWLAIHPNCGTNLAVGTSLALAGTLFGMTSRRTSTRVVSCVASMAAGYLAARPLGSTVQRLLTTSPEHDNIRIVSIRRKRFINGHVVEVLTEAL